jgi:hypothetical protein
MRDLDPVALEIATHRLAAIAEEMGVVLGRTALSPNVKERRDYSCALFDARGGLAAQAAHIPVHLGATPLSVRAAIARVPMGPDDVVVLNDPFAGGTHLPDVTVVAPVFARGARRPFAYVANRAHHADIGGMSPGSMPLASDIFQEGFRLPPVKLVARGRLVDDVVALFLANTRVPAEREGDLRAQWAALRVGADRLRALAAGRGGVSRLAHEMAALQDYSAALMRSTLAALPRGTYRAHDVLDDDGLGAVSLRLAVTVRIAGGRARIDFTGTAPQTRGPVNANLAVTRSAVLYVFAALAGEAIPPNEGLARPLDILAPEGSLVNALLPAAVAGGNVAAHRRRAAACARACGSRPHSGRELRLDEQRGARRHHRRPGVRVLRDDRRRRGCGPVGSRRVGGAHAHDEHHEHADRGAGVVLPARRPPLRAASRIGRKRALPGGSGCDSRDRVPDGCRGDAARRATPRPAVRACGRRSGCTRPRLARARRQTSPAPGKDDAASAAGRSDLRRDAGRRGVRNRPTSRAQGQAACQAAFVTRSTRRSSSCTRRFSSDTSFARASPARETA